MNVEQLYFDRFDLHTIDDQIQEKVRILLGPLRTKSEVHHEHYLHSLRVAHHLYNVLEAAHLDPKVALFAGGLHDIGKAQTPVSTLGKTEGWTESDTKIMWSHVMDSYRLLRDCFDFTAEVILWHHKFQRDGYPKRVPKPLHDYSIGTSVMIPYYGRLLSICDQYDAMHRKNDRNEGNSDYQEMLLSWNPDQRIFIQNLFDMGALTEDLYQSA